MASNPGLSRQRRDQILDAAALVFARMGVHDARIDDIVAEAALSKGAVYWYFKGKDDLIAAFVERLFMRAIENFKQFLELDQPFKQRMEAVSRYFAADIRRLSRLRGALLEYYALASREQRVRRRVRAYLEQYIDLFAMMIGEAIARGECRRVDPRKTALSIDAMYEGLTVLWLVDTADFKVDEMVTHSTSLILAALLPEAL